MEPKRRNGRENVDELLDTAERFLEMGLPMAQLLQRIERQSLTSAQKQRWVWLIDAMICRRTAGPPPIKRDPLDDLPVC